jgi:hypothetical protein
MVNAWLRCKPEPEQRPNGSVPARTQRARSKCRRNLRAAGSQANPRACQRASARRACSEHARHDVLVAESVPRQRRRTCLGRCKPREIEMPKEAERRRKPGEPATMTGQARRRARAPEDLLQPPRAQRDQVPNEPNSRGNSDESAAMTGWHGAPARAPLDLLRPLQARARSSYQTNPGRPPKLDDSAI